MIIRMVGVYLSRKEVLLWPVLEIKMEFFYIM